MSFDRPTTPAGGEYLEIPSTQGPALQLMALVLKSVWAALCVQLGIVNEQWAATRARAYFAEKRGLAK